MRSWSAVLLALSEHKPLDSGASTYQTGRCMQCTGTPREPEAPRLLLLSEAQQHSMSRAELSRGVVVGVSGHTLATQPGGACSLSRPALPLYTPSCACRNVMPVLPLSRNIPPPPPAQSQHVRRRGRPGHCREFLALALDSSPQQHQQQQRALQSCRLMPYAAVPERLQAHKQPG